MTKFEAPIADMIIVGSGAAGLTAAVTALHLGNTVEVIEGTPFIGGSTAYSEGMIWVPGNAEAQQQLDVPLEEEKTAALNYLKASSDNHFDETRASTYVAHAAEMLSFIEAQSLLRFQLNRNSRDYYPDREGATHGIRALNPQPFDARILGRRRFTHIRRPLETMMLFGGMSIASGDLADFMKAGRSPVAALRVLKLIAAYWLDRLKGWSRGTRIANGNAIVGALACAVTGAGSSIRVGWPVDALIMDGSRVVGVRSGAQALRARKGVLLATGGYTSRPEEVRRWLAPNLGKESDDHRPIPPEADGLSAIELATAIGASVDLHVSQPVLWVPTSLVPVNGKSVPWPHFGDRAKPGVIVIGPNGRRFANEACVYHDFVPAMIEVCKDRSSSIHAWIIADHAALRRYGLGAVGPFPMPLGSCIASGYLKRAKTLTELANAIGVDPLEFEATVTRFNSDASNGHDRSFGRGASPYDRSNGDPDHLPNPSLRPLDRPPFYAIRMSPGDIGGFIGLKTDAGARVLRDDGSVIDGLYAAGNAAAVVTGGTYPAAGITIGSAMTFGYLAARHISEDVYDWHAARATE